MVKKNFKFYEVLFTILSTAILQYEVLFTMLSRAILQYSVKKIAEGPLMIFALAMALS